jgi:hypothetical protein
MTEREAAACRAAELMASLCTTEGTIEDRQELSRLLREQRLTLAEFAAALSDLANERGAAAYVWNQDTQNHIHEWRCENAWERRLESGASELRVLVRCWRCDSLAEFGGPMTPRCVPGEHWVWMGAGWQRTERPFGGGERESPRG